VALTRAQKLAVLTSARQRFMYGHLQENPDSQFIAEIGEFYLERLGLAKSVKTIYESPKSHSNKKATIDITPGYQSVETNLSVGDKIKHKTFGNGVVVAISADKATIAFGKEIGIKVLMKDHPSIEKTR
jgi:DNA helicase-2/ATP-dependent DNA helicase PcrA